MEFHAVRYQDDAAGADERSLPYQPALDGLRALAVTAVLAYHAGLTWARGGFLGVDAFFVLSGYLITSLLIVEWRNTGTIDLPAFWARRARRLLPALFLLLVGIAGYALVFAEPEELDKLRNASLATLGYVANWQLAFSGESYFDQFSLPSPLRHTWSLAIEEQWYLIWPLLFVLLLRLGRSSLAVLFTASLVMIAGSALLMAWLYDPGADPSRIYYGTDTRAQSLLVGAVLAMLLAWHGPLRASAARLLLQLTALAGAIFTGWLWVSASDDSSFLYQGGLLVSAIAIAAVIAAVVQPQRGPLGRLLSLSPLRGLGRISYGVYLWHWPVYLVLTPVRTGWHGYGLLAVQVAVTLALAIASYYVIENPVRRGALRSWRAWTVAPTAAAVLVIALVMVTRGGTQPFAFLDEAAAQAAIPTATMPVAAFDIGDVSAAFPFKVLEVERVVNYPVNGTDVVVFHKLGTVSALDRTLIIDSDDIGATGVFDAQLDGQKLTFSLKDDRFIDDQTGSFWNILGEAVEGEMAGKSLTPIVHGNHFWFAWGAFNPDTLIYKGRG